MAPSSRFASSLKPSVAYRVLNFSALWKKQTTLPSLAYAGIPYQVFGERSGALALMIAWSRLAMARSGSGISAIFASTSLSPSALSCRARFRLQLLGALLHRGSFLGRESLGRLAGRGGALGGARGALLRRFLLSHREAPPQDGSAQFLDIEHMAPGSRATWDTRPRRPVSRLDSRSGREQHDAVFLGQAAEDEHLALEAGDALGLEPEDTHDLPAEELLATVMGELRARASGAASAEVDRELVRGVARLREVLDVGDDADRELEALELVPGRGHDAANDSRSARCSL